MRTFMLIALACLALCSCQRTPGGVVDKVLMDFGLRDKPEGYVSGSDRVFQNLDAVGASEIKRMNLAGQHGEVKYHKQSDLKGKYYKEVKVYESYIPTEAKPVTKPTQGERGFQGFIEYTYRMYQSARKDTRTEAAAESASIGTAETGHESYRYAFGPSGTWNGSKGAKVRN